MSTAVFAFNPHAFVGRFSVLVQENALAAAGLTPNQGGGPAVNAGNRVTLTAANYILHFTFSMSGHSHNVVVLTVSPNPLAGSRLCYFLPWYPDAATEITLGNGAPYFFTSTLTGCSVKAHGPKATPTVIHANARSTYRNQYQTTYNAAPGHLSAKDVHALAEAAGSQQAQAAINAMLPVGVGGGVVTKADYVGQATRAAIRNAGKRLDVGDDYKVSKIKPDLYQQVKLQSGGFVYGTLGPGGWDIYYQASLVVTGKAVKKGLFQRGSKALMNEEVVLGPPRQIF